MIYPDPDVKVLEKFKNIRQEQNFGTICQLNWDIIHDRQGGISGRRNP